MNDNRGRPTAESNRLLIVWGSILFLALVMAVCGYGVYILSCPPVIGEADKATLSTAYATWALFVVTAFLVFGIVLGWLQLKADHERPRRESALRLGSDWVENHSERGSAALILINAFDPPQIVCVKNRQEMWVDSKHLYLLSRVFPKFLDENKKKLPSEKLDEIVCSMINGKPMYKISEDESAELRWLVVQYLNRIEVVFLAWLKSIADKEMIEEQFMPLLDIEEGDLLASRFRQGTQNKKAWPATNAFVEEWKRRNQDKSIARSVVA